MQEEKENLKDKYQKTTINLYLREIKDTPCKKNRMLLKQGQLENIKKFLETQNTRSEITFKTRARRQSSGTIFEGRIKKNRGQKKKHKKIREPVEESNI